MPKLSGPTRDYRVVQIHPLLRCNLRCLHCYSSSSPQESTGLSLDSLISALSLFRKEGFNAVGISGGEPLLYQGLAGLLQHARGLGMLTTVTTNAMLVTEERAEMLRERADLVAVSLDGPPESHNRLRDHPKAFELMTTGVERLKHAGIPFGFIFTLTLHNLHELGWIAEHAVAQGAALLQVHPLEEVGRATRELQGSAPDALELARGFIEVARLQKQYVGRLVIQYDVADLELLCAKPERGYAVEPAACCAMDAETAAPLADMIAPIIVEADGVIVPIQYNFSRDYQIGNVHSASLESQLGAWKRETFREFLALCRNVHGRLTKDVTLELPFVNWYSAVLQESHLGRMKPKNDARPAPEIELNTTG